MYLLFESRQWFWAILHFYWSISFQCIKPVRSTYDIHLKLTFASIYSMQIIFLFPILFFPYYAHCTLSQNQNAKYYLVDYVWKCQKSKHTQKKKQSRNLPSLNWTHIWRNAWFHGSSINTFSQFQRWIVRSLKMNEERKYDYRSDDIQRLLRVSSS